MAQIPVNMNSTAFKVDQTFFEIGEFKYTPDDFERDYCGMSGIGNKCLRALQYSCFRASKPEQVDPRTQRIFDLGHIMEEYIVQCLKHAGLIITRQQAEIIGFAGHWKGHIDGVAENVPEAPKTEHLLEVKTHNDKSFQAVRKEGVEASKPEHYAQMTRYMGGLKLSRGLYVAYNKNDSSYYFERVRYDKSFGNELIRKESEVMLAEKLFPRIGSGKPTWHDCKWCSHKGVCFGKEIPDINCRTCNFVDMCDGGIWKCGLDNSNLTFSQQKAACKMYELSNLLKT